MREVKRRFWLATHDALFWLGMRRCALWAVVHAAEYTDWGEGADLSGGSGEGPF